MSELLELAEQVVAQARGGELVEAYVVRSRETEVKVFGGDVESLSSASTSGIAVRVVVDGRQGFAYTGSLEGDVPAETLAEARDNARFAGVDEFNGVAEPDGVAPPELKTDTGKLAGAPTDRKVELALELERAAKAADSRVRGVESANYVDEVSASAVATSTGVRAESEDAVCYISAFVMVGTGDETQTGFWFSVGEELDELDVDTTARLAAERATRMLGAVQPPSRRLTVVLDPWVTSQFLSIIGGTLSGEAVLKGYSPFADRMGQLIASPAVSLVEDPTNPEAFGSSRYDAEGLATRRLPLIESGLLANFAHNSYTGRRSGHGSTGSARRAAGLAGTVGVGCRALSLVPGTASQEELVSQIDDGLLVQSVKGLHSGVNPISGDFSTGAEGVLISNGALAGPVREITIGSTLQRMLQDVAAVGNDVAWLPTSAAGVSLVVNDVTMSGK